MHTSDLLKAKYDAQRALAERAKRDSRAYEEVVEEEVRELFHRNGWRLRFSKRRGGVLTHSQDA